MLTRILLGWIGPPVITVAAVLLNQHLHGYITGWLPLAVAALMLLTTRDSRWELAGWKTRSPVV